MASEEWADAVIYNRELYGKSERERLRRINYTRQRRGMPKLSSLSETRLRNTEAQ